MTKKAIILVGGPKHGSQFRPLSLKCPMPLFPVAGTPLVMHHIRALKTAKIDEIILLGTYSDHLFSDVVLSAYRETGVPVKISSYPSSRVLFLLSTNLAVLKYAYSRYLQEYADLGTAGGIYHFRDLIERGRPEMLIVLHGNLCCNFPIQELLQFHENISTEDHATIMGVTARPDQSHQYGNVVVDESTQAVLHYVEKPTTCVSCKVNGGVYVFSLNILERIKQTTTQSILRQTFFLLCQVKSAGSAVYANRFYLGEYRKLNPRALASPSSDGPDIAGDVSIDSTAIVHPTAKVGPNVTIGPYCVINEGVRIKDSIILTNCLVEKNACVLNSIVGWNSVIRPWSRVEGLPVGADPNNPSTHISQKPLFNADGKLEPNISVLGEGVVIHEGRMLLHSLVLPNKEITRNHKNEIIL
eukprot:gene7016-407_t